MSGSIIPTPAYKASNWQSFGTQVEKQRLGFLSLSLTNYDNNSVPQIAAGSVVEISGSIFKFDSNDSIGGTPSSSAFNYIMLEVSGSGDTQTVSGSWTTTAPTWNDAKQGWYNATGNKRYIGGCYYTTSLTYEMKWVYGGKGTGPIDRSISVHMIGPRTAAAITAGTQCYSLGAFWYWAGATSNSQGGYCPIVFPRFFIIENMVSDCSSYVGGTLVVELRSSSPTLSSSSLLANTSHTANGSQNDNSITNPLVRDYSGAESSFFIYCYNSTNPASFRLEGVEIEGKEIVRRAA